LTRNKGDKDYSKSEKHLLISLINDYSLFGAHDGEILQMFSNKIDKKNNYNKLDLSRLLKEKYPLAP
jgi:hypothetical protein